MAKRTLLEMVQDLLSDMDSDEVNSISDTVESEQVARIIRQTYFNMVVELDIPEHKKFFPLVGLGSLTKPNYLEIPDQVKTIDLIKYNVRKSTDTKDIYKTIDYLSPEEFKDKINQRDSSDSDVETIEDFGGTNLLIKNDVAPSYWTTFSEQYIVFDSFDNTVDSTIQGSKSECWGIQEPSFSISDSFIPDLDSNLFPQLYAEAKSICFLDLKQTSNPKAEQVSRRLNIANHKRKRKLTGRHGYPDYGRK